MSLIRPYDRDSLRERFNTAEPFRHLVIDDFLQDDFVREVAASYPSSERAAAIGHEFSALNERGKIQVTDAALFPPPVAHLNELLAAESFIDDLSYITGMPPLLWDPQLAGGGMHCTGPRGRLDVHVDFNYHDGMHRRLNILVYLNPRWQRDWGGAIELWDKDVQHCVHSLEPRLNRCVIFETSQISYHGVEPVACPDGTARISFAAYYYTKEAPAGWDGSTHSTMFRARPGEKLREKVLLPLERARNEAVPALKGYIKKLIGRA